jgi:hypothetical protein
VVAGRDCIADADVVVIPIGEHDLLLDSPGRHFEKVWWGKLVVLGICLALILKIGYRDDFFWRRALDKIYRAVCYTGVAVDQYQFILGC